MNKRKLVKYLLFFLFGYILLALIWWAILLIQLNDKLYFMKSNLVELEHSGASTTEIIELRAALTIERRKQIKMIIGEGTVFGISTLAGLWFIYRSYQTELKLVEQQKDFLVSITHELKTPLASINLVVDTLKKRKLPVAQEQSLYDTAGSEVNRLNTLVNNLLLAAKVEGNYQYNFEKLDIVDLVNNILSKFRQKFPDTKINFRPHTQAVTIDGDKETMISLVNNLTENAIKYGNGFVEINTQIKGQNLVLSFLDNGKGFDNKEVEKIFNKFYRLEQSRKDASKGTGLGLFIVKQIVNAYQGSIRIKSTKNKGSRFEIEIPQTQKK
jgi:signal transduction histidine kinase